MKPKPIIVLSGSINRLPSPLSLPNLRFLVSAFLFWFSEPAFPAAPTEVALTIAIRPGSEAGGLNVRSTALPGELFDFRTCEGVVVGSNDFGLFQVKLPEAFGDGNKSWRREGNVWSYSWAYPQGLTVQVTVEPDDDSLKLRYTLRNTGSNALDAVQLHTCIPTTEAPGFFPSPARTGLLTNWSELYNRLNVWSGSNNFRFVDTQLGVREPHLSLVRKGAVPVKWGWWVNGQENFDLPLIALVSRDGQKTVALAFEQAVWASANTGDARACFHLFPWFGRIESGQSVTTRGRLYLLRGGAQVALDRFCRDFPQIAASSGIPVAPAHALTLAFEEPHWLVIRGPQLAGRDIRINYLEAYCRAGSTHADWVKHTMIGHRVELLSLSDDRKVLRLRDTLEDGVTVEHLIRAGEDEVTFRLTAHNPGTARSEAHWAQACVRLADFTGFDPDGPDLDDYLPKCFIFLNGKLTRLSDVRPWSKEGFYTPGQSWCPKGVPRTDVNPRPLSPLITDNGLIGAFSEDEKLLFATAWEPYQELFQGVARCLHSDFRLGGLQPGETKRVRGSIYIITNDVPALLTRYARDFPEHETGSSEPAPSPRALAFYYPWYGNPATDGRYANWNHPVAVRNEPPRSFPGGDDIGSNFYPALGCYSANDPAVVREHMRQLRQAGVGVLSVSWWGKNTFTDRALPRLFEAAEAAGLKINFHIEPFPGRNAVKTREAIAYLVGKFGASPACHRLPAYGNRPLFFVYDSYLTPATEWADVLTPQGKHTLRGTEADAVVLGLWVKEKEDQFLLEGGFDGFYTYFATDGFTYGSTVTNWPRMADWARANLQLFVPCVAPGYIDTRIRPWNGVNTRDRKSGVYYDHMWSAALGVSPKLVGITSFNEWHEGTQIETATAKQIPGFTYLEYQPLRPDYYLDRTAFWVKRLSAQ